MTHFRITLTRGRGANVRMVSELHQKVHTWPSGWFNALRTGASVHVRVCWKPDEACEGLEHGK